jgi:hypothetical protein
MTIRFRMSFVFLINFKTMGSFLVAVKMQRPLSFSAKKNVFGAKVTFVQSKF